MKIFLFLLSFICIIFWAASPAFAHLPGQPPYVLIDDRYANLYHVPSTSLPTFSLPQDDAPETYLVNRPVSFSIDTQRLIAPPVSIPSSVVSESKFIWDFGDQHGDAGLHVVHIYQKPGSYFMRLTVKDPSLSTPQLLDIALLQVLPSRNYVLPRSIITMDNIPVKDASHEATISFSIPHFFSAKSSIHGTTNIISYFWDFGDGTYSTQPNVYHAYSPTFREAFPLLRVKDINGFISDSYMTIINQSFNLQNTITQKSANVQNKNSFFQLPWILIWIILLCLIIFILLRIVAFLQKRWIL